MINHMKEININSLNTTYLNSMKVYPDEFIHFIKKHNLTPPRITSGNGKALLAMLLNPSFYFTRASCRTFVEIMKIDTADSIQLFNKHEQWGIKTSNIRGKYYIKTPYELSNKYKMRKGFKYDGTLEEKNNAIEEIKGHIKSNYCDVPNSDWQLGHKNPDSTDNSNNNLVLQPPIQGKYRDRYIFLDTLTKIPTPKEFKFLVSNNNSPYTTSQLKELRNYLNGLDL